MFLLRFPLSGEQNLRGEGFWERSSLGHRRILRASIEITFVSCSLQPKREADIAL